MARSFNGTTEKITAASNITGTAAMTLSCWVNTNTVAAGFRTCFSFQSDITTYQNGSHFAYFNDQQNLNPGTATISVNTWYNVVHVYDSVNGLHAYVNGVSDGTAAAVAGLTLNSNIVTIGQDSTGTRWWSGSIADCAAWSTNLTAGEALALANGARPYTIRPQNLLVYYPVDGLASPEIDLSGKADNGTLTGTTSAFGPPFMMLTPRMPLIIAPAAAAAQTFQAAWAMRNRIVVEGIGI